MPPIAPKIAPTASDCAPAKATAAPERPPRTRRAIKTGGRVRLGIEGSLSATSSPAARRENNATVAVAPIKLRTVLWRVIQLRCAAQATIAGGVMERRPVATPIAKARRRTRNGVMRRQPPYSRLKSVLFKLLNRQREI